MKRLYFVMMVIACVFTACQTPPVKNQINENQINVVSGDKPAKEFL
ncbi:MAG: hypothetical protein LBL56_03320 [Treponema sp.]|jgi:hypothetical protein|nr:hypothetical protein [Treponema sp.]